MTAKRLVFDLEMKKRFKKTPQWDNIIGGVHCMIRGVVVTHWNDGTFSAKYISIPDETQEERDLETLVNRYSLMSPEALLEHVRVNGFAEALLQELERLNRTIRCRDEFFWGLMACVVAIVALIICVPTPKR